MKNGWAPQEAEKLPEQGVIEGQFTVDATSVRTVVGELRLYETKIVAFNPTTALLSKLELEYKNRIYDVTSKDGDAAAREARRKLVAARVALEGVRKQEKADILERGKLIDSEAKWIEKSLRDLEDPIDTQIKAEETRKAVEKAERDRIEKERTDAIRAKINAIKEMALSNIGQPSAIIQLAIDVATDMPITKEEFAEFAVEADTVRGETLVALHRMFGAVEALEKQQEEVKAREEAVKRQALETADREKAVAQREQVLDDKGSKGPEPVATPPAPSPSIPSGNKEQLYSINLTHILPHGLKVRMPWRYDAVSGEMRGANGPIVFESCQATLGAFLAELSKDLARAT